MSSAITMQMLWGSYADELSIEECGRILEPVLSFAPETPEALVPNFKLLPDGPRIHSVFVFTMSYVLEADVSSATFDIIDRRRIQVMRWTFRDIEQKMEGRDPVRYELATLQLSHSPTNLSEMNYIGSCRKDWANRLQKLLPARAVLSTL